MGGAAKEGAAVAAPPRAEDHGAWLRRRWIHEARTAEDIGALAAALRVHGIGTVYPFVGPMTPGGRFGWRDGEVLQPYDPETARVFFARVHALDPTLQVLPWTGGVNDRDVHLASPEWRADFVREARALVDLGADGIHVNIEPMLSGAEGYVDLLGELRAAFGARGRISVAAYPPPTPLHPYPDVHWELAFLTRVCQLVDDVSVMAYDTALPTKAAYTALMTTWSAELAGAMGGGTCAWRIGVPAYEDDKPWHRPDAETLDAALAGVTAGLGAPPSNYRGVALYAAWTTDAAEWAVFDRWRGAEPAGVLVE